MTTRTEDVEAALAWIGGEVTRQERASAHATTFQGVVGHQAAANHLRTILASHAAQAERIASLEAGVRLIRAAAQGDGHAHLIIKECDALLSGKASA